MKPQDRWHPEMIAARKIIDAATAKEPPVTLADPVDASRIVNDRIGMIWCDGGPQMAEVSERWVLARGRRVLCRINRPRTDKKLPVLVWLHGGGWVWSSVETHDRLCRELAASADIATVSIDYALAPEAKFPVALQEIVAVLRALGDTDWGIDASRIVVGGNSAGGNLAFAAALALRDQGGPKLRGIHALYPVTNNDFSLPSYREFAEGYVLTTESMKQYWDIYLRDAADRLNPLAAPLRADLRGMPPTLIQLAELDVLCSEGAAMAEKLRAAGTPAELKTYPGVLHGFMRLTKSLSAARTAVDDAGAWLRGVMA